MLKKILFFNLIIIYSTAYTGDLNKPTGIVLQRVIGDHEWLEARTSCSFKLEGERTFAFAYQYPDSRLKFGIKIAP